MRRDMRLYNSVQLSKFDGCEADHLRNGFVTSLIVEGIKIVLSASASSSDVMERSGGIMIPHAHDLLLIHLAAEGRPLHVVCSF